MTLIDRLKLEVERGHSNALTPVTVKDLLKLVLRLDAQDKVLRHLLTSAPQQLHEASLACSSRKYLD